MKPKPVGPPFRVVARSLSAVIEDCLATSPPVAWMGRASAPTNDVAPIYEHRANAPRRVVEAPCDVEASSIMKCRGVYRVAVARANVVRRELQTRERLSKAFPDPDPGSGTWVAV